MPLWRRGQEKSLRCRALTRTCQGPGTLRSTSCWSSHTKLANLSGRQLCPTERLSNKPEVKPPGRDRTVLNLSTGPQRPLSSLHYYHILPYLDWSWPQKLIISIPVYPAPHWSLAQSRVHKYLLDVVISKQRFNIWKRLHNSPRSSDMALSAKTLNQVMAGSNSCIALTVIGVFISVALLVNTPQHSLKSDAS